MTAFSINELERALAGGQPLTDDQGRALLAMPDLVRVGTVASDTRDRRRGRDVTYVRVFETQGPLPDAWPAGAGEIRLTGRPPSAEAAVARAFAAVERAGVVPVTAWSLADLVSLGGSDDGIVSLVRGLCEAGIAAVAETLFDTVDITSIHRVIDAGLPVPVIGFERRPADPVAALRRIHDLQRATGAVRAVAPLPRQAPAEHPSTGYDDVRLVALARVLLDNVGDIQVDWQAHGPKLAQVALLFGASDFDRVSPGDEAPLGHRRAPLEEVRRNIEAASLTPVARNARFERIGA